MSRIYNSSSSKPLVATNTSTSNNNSNSNSNTSKMTTNNSTATTTTAVNLRSINSDLAPKVFVNNLISNRNGNINDLINNGKCLCNGCCKEIIFLILS